MDLFDHAESVRARDEGITKVALNNPCFMDQALAYLKSRRALDSTIGEFTGEEIRHWLQVRNIKPDHQNAWGALILTAQRRKIIVGTGRYVAMTLKTSRARKNQVYRWATSGEENGKVEAR